MGSFTCAVTIFLIGISAVSSISINTENEELQYEQNTQLAPLNRHIRSFNFLTSIKERIDQVIVNIQNVAVTASNAVDGFSVDVKDVLSKVNDVINTDLATIRQKLDSAVTGGLTSLSQLASSIKPECLLAEEAKSATLIVSTVNKLAQCVENPFTAITKAIVDLAARASTAAGDADTYVSEVGQCFQGSSVFSCLIAVLGRAQASVMILATSVAGQITSIAATVSGLQTFILSCAINEIVSASLGAATIAASVGVCAVNTILAG